MAGAASGRLPSPRLRPRSAARSAGWPHLLWA